MLGRTIAILACGAVLYRCAWPGHEGNIQAGGVFVMMAPLAGDTLLHIAVWREYEDVVGRLLGVGANPNLADVDGYTAAHAAVYVGNVSILGLLLEHGADVCANLARVVWRPRCGQFCLGRGHLTGDAFNSGKGVVGVCCMHDPC
jgi:hypothetical protein